MTVPHIVTVDLAHIGTQPQLDVSTSKKSDQPTNYQSFTRWWMSSFNSIFRWFGVVQKYRSSPIFWEILWSCQGWTPLFWCGRLVVSLVRMLLSAVGDVNPSDLLGTYPNRPTKTKYDHISAVYFGKRIFQPACQIESHQISTYWWLFVPWVPQL